MLISVPKLYGEFLTSGRCEFKRNSILLRFPVRVSVLREIQPAIANTGLEETYLKQRSNASSRLLSVNRLIVTMPKALLRKLPSSRDLLELWDALIKGTR